MPEASRSLDGRFGHGPRPNPASEFRANRFDIADGDIEDVADKRLLEEMAQGKPVIQIVGDQCGHMVRCSSTNPEDIPKSSCALGARPPARFARVVGVQFGRHRH